MNLDQRHDAVKRFHTDPNIKIMIAGLKCGGQALNLTCANRVISIDLWWNRMCATKTSLFPTTLMKPVQIPLSSRLSDASFGLGSTKRRMSAAS
jgi:hypothetical protein